MVITTAYSSSFVYLFVQLLKKENNGLDTVFQRRKVQDYSFLLQEKPNVLDIRKWSLGENGLGNNAREGKHGKTLVPKPVLSAAHTGPAGPWGYSLRR